MWRNFLKLVSEEKVKQAEELIVAEARGREDEFTDLLLLESILLRFDYPTLL